MRCDCARLPRPSAPLSARLIQSEFAILVCRAVAAHHAAAGAPGTVACEAGVAPRGKHIQGACLAREE